MPKTQAYKSAQQSGKTPSNWFAQTKTKNAPARMVRLNAYNQTTVKLPYANIFYFTSYELLNYLLNHF